jgi:hypothetical protein
MPESTVAATLFFEQIEVNNLAVSNLRETFLNLLNIHDLNDNAYYDFSFDSAVISTFNMLCIMQAYINFL